MRDKTKLKIIDWVKMTLKYKDPVHAVRKAPTYIHLSSNEIKRRIQEVRCESKIENKFISDDNLNRIIASAMLAKVMQLGVIQFNKENIRGEQFIRARAFFVLPPNKWEDSF